MSFSLLREAWKLAGRAHARQKYLMDGTNVSYLAHVGNVASLAKEGCLRDARGDPQVAEFVGILHDVVEDGDIENIRALIREIFGNKVLECVLAVTKKPELRGRAASDEALSRIMDAPVEAGIVKLADRACNIGGLPREGWTAAKIADYLDESEHILRCLGGHSPTLAGLLDERIRVWQQRGENHAGERKP